MISVYTSSDISYASDASAPLSGTIAKNVTFDSTFLNLGNEEPVDLSRFANGSAVFPGIYQTSIYVNNVQVSNSNLKFKAQADNSVHPCITVDIIKNINFNYEALPSDFLKKNGSAEECVDLQKAIPQAQLNYDSNEQRLDIIIPQKYMLQTARDSVSPSLWDSGIPAFMLGYNLNAYTSHSNNVDYKSFYGGINAGLNIGSWYLRHNGAYNWTQDGEKKYDSINTYLQHDIPSIKGRALLGQSNTNGQVFDTLPFSGIQLASDERMLPASLRGYAPEIRGIARTNAQVTIRQSGQVIYQTTVTPGEFLIKDLYPTGYGGDLRVTVREADGSEQEFLVPYASVAQLLRPGASKYAITAGELRNDRIHGKPALYQGTYQYGLTNALTGYGGLQLSQDYYAIQLGLATGTSLGAFALDITQARTHLNNVTDEDGRHSTGNYMSGQSYRLTYSKTVPETNSTLSLAAYRFSTDGYMDYLTAMETRDAVADGLSPDSVWRAKNRFTVTAGQGLPDNWGQFYASGSLQNYWNKDGADKQYQAGYSNKYKQLSYSISINRTYSNFESAQNNYLLSFSLPLGYAYEAQTPQLRLDLTKDGSGRYGQQAAVSGSLGEDNQFSYGVTAMHANQGVGSSGSVNGQYRTPATSLSGTYSAGSGYHSASAGMSGAIVAHSGGVTFTPYNADTYALVEAEGASGARVSSYPGVYIDSNGYALVPYLDPYQLNNVSIDPKGIDFDVELANSSQKVAPYSGAVVKVKYDTKKGMPILINSTYMQQPIPFGASVFNSAGDYVGAVGQGGQVYARVAKEKGQLKVSWGDGAEMQCSINYQMMPQAKKSNTNAIQRFNTQCKPMTSGNGKSGMMAGISSLSSNKESS
ncbi:fimbrial biogenesis outer membrane usher protein [Serratia proteamaculans]|nr:fimbrial biogenesis outer membrane usher protein [Serratia proteamaculans]NTZ28312.1 fimbrial biogenesis outer membrane usher protein [Serratia proteamaculans]